MPFGILCESPLLRESESEYFKGPLNSNGEAAKTEAVEMK